MSHLFLVSNDDGYQSPGIEVLASVMAEFGEVVVVAPDQEHSGASNSLTLQSPVRVRRAANGYYHASGTPTDCVHIAITGLLDRAPDMVVSGINAGENLADDVLYSGTVAAAMEGRFLGCPSVAISLAGDELKNYDTAAWAVRTLIGNLLEQPLSDCRLLNVNVPDVPVAAIRGFKATRLGQRHKSSDVVRQLDPRGRTIYWIGTAGAGHDTGPGTDFEAIHNGYVSVTPLHVDLTNYRTLDYLADWLDHRQRQ
ncbi:MAG: 5'/3'-nucleotidase SurE [Gammaproteobacteria bacterium]|nr:5'/3'-nucleotidase SurE [Gammaproteobacteria bacterium]